MNSTNRPDAVHVDSKVFNVMVPVVALVEADCERHAIDAVESKLRAAGFEPYEGDPGSDAFESESQTKGN